MTSIPIKKEYRSPQHVDLYCKAGGVGKYPGYIGQVECRDAMQIFQLKPLWTARFPDPLKACGGGLRDKDPTCAVIAPDASHPGVVMINDYTYTINIDLI